MEQAYSGVIARTLNREERRVPISSKEDGPLVIEKLESSKAVFLREFLECHSSLLLRDLARHGSLLLRGFDVDSPVDFERHILSIRGMSGMNEVLLSEPGRTIVGGTRFVFYTNMLVKTGGALPFGMFHTENYANPDVPHYVSFFCQTPSKLGGETGLLNTAKMYADLPDTLKRKLEERACLVALHPVTEMAKRYGMSAGTIAEFCEAVGLPVVTLRSAQYVAIYKPSVVQHPITDERTLLVAFGVIPSITKPVLNEFSMDYLGSQWLLHRLFWKAPPWVEHVVERMSYASVVQRTGVIVITEPLPAVPDALPLTALFSPEETRMLAAIMRSRYFSFLWKRGDILILDNFKVAHNGMPGRGKRELKVMMCNPVLLPLSGNSPGLHVFPHSSDSRESLGTQLARLRDRAQGSVG